MSVLGGGVGLGGAGVEPHQVAPVDEGEGLVVVDHFFRRGFGAAGRLVFEAPVGGAVAEALAADLVVHVAEEVAGPARGTA